MPPRKSTRKPKITEPKAEEEPSLNIAEEAPDIKPRIHNVTVGAVPPPPPQAVNTSKLSSNDLKSYNSQKSAALPDLSERKRFHAWPVHKRPLDKFISPRSGTLCLPRWYRSGGVNGTKGKEVVEIHVKAGEDLNNTVWRWYDTMVDFSGKEGKHYEGARNYVADGIRPHRCVRIPMAHFFLFADKISNREGTSILDHLPNLQAMRYIRRPGMKYALNGGTIF
jgi:hypothetical protein